MIKRFRWPSAEGSHNGGSTPQGGNGTTNGKSESGLSAPSGRVAKDGTRIGKRINNGGPRFGNPNGTRGGARFGNPNGTRGTGHHPGRKPGTPNRMTREIREAAARSGELPHEFALRVTRSKVGSIISGHKITWDDIKWAAGQCMNYYAPKQTSIKLTGPNNGPVQFVQLDPVMLAHATPEELTALDQLLSRLQSGVAPQPTVSPDEYAKTLN